ncbi:MAG: hypothetical protein QM758_07215 [Armatimonas sp.]
MSRLKRFATGTGITLVALSGLTGYWYKNHYVVPPEPVRNVTMPSPNGFDTLQEAVKLEVARQGSVSTSPSREDPPTSLEQRLALLEANKPAIEKTREALRQEFQQPVISWPGTAFPEYAKVREQARMLAFASRTYAEVGNTTEAMDCALDAIELGVKLPRGGMLIGNLVGIACESIGQKAMWELADKLSPLEARAASERMTRIRAARWPFANVLEEERLFARQGTRATYAGGPIAAWKSTGQLLDSTDQSVAAVEGMAGIEDAPKPTLAEQAQRLWARTQVVYYGPKTTLENGDRWMTALQEQAKQPWNPSRPEPQMPTDPLNQIIAPVFSQASFKQVEIDARGALLEAYLLQRATLGDLTSSGEPLTLPTDPFSPDKAHLHYRMDGSTFILWSVGPDGKDDNGKPIDMEGKKGYVTAEKTGDIVARVNTF